ncbi:hypothetical protein C9374_005586 [Naegleria lovaniensis]|uniref:Uncharacterized protein n=1 Tax=Naegleria lovaniensis TaxID=51637 RepID=A0AA88KI22_NAELO|nr:uncharacterized protein C9374_005586 [Naegleria lovaniensis]KAG2382384.1 hypothetical protein C9374_005586 [Naegleria lovaniensis]
MILSPNTTPALVKRIYEISARAKQLKTLLPIATKIVDYELNELMYQVRIAVAGYLKTSNLEKEIEKEQEAEEKHVKIPKQEEAPLTQDPFRPIDTTLEVTSVEPYHTMLLNKFMVIPEHLLIITKEFKPQTEHLTMDDFKSVVTTLKQLHEGNQDADDYICFYNRGLYSGASQPHKHIQLIPRRERNEATLEWTPIENFPLPRQFDIHVSKYPSTVTDFKDFSFLHQIRSIKHCFEFSDDAAIVKALFEVYVSMLKELDMYEDRVVKDSEERVLKIQCNAGEIYEISLCPKRYPSYNLLFSKKWMVLVPRRNENYMGISCNSLAFLHGFFAKTDAHWEHLKSEVKIPKLLEYLTFPSHHDHATSANK